jgi:hypothetical protein
MNLQIKKASKKESKLRMSLIGPSGSGKTYTGLSIADGFGKILVVDTERGSASKYADRFDFDVVEFEDFAPEKFIDIIKHVDAMPDAERYDVLFIDSLSHAWMGKGGVLEMHDKASKKTQNSFAAWKDVTPKQNELIEAILQSKVHVIVTMRAKTEYVQQKDEKTGRTSIKKVGIAPVQRNDIEYEFDVVGELDYENNFIIGKTRCPALADQVFTRAGGNVAEILKVWLSGEKEKPTIVRPLQASVPPLPAHTGAINEFSKNDKSVSNDVKGKLLAENGYVKRVNAGYEVTETVNGTPIKYLVEKKSGVIVCSCADYADGRAEADNYKCPHIFAVQFYAANQSKVETKVA